MVKRHTNLVMLTIILFLAGSLVNAQALTADHNSVTAFDGIPHSFIEQAQSQFRIYYGHTSHGSQLLAGMAILKDSTSVFDYDNGAVLPIDEHYNDLGNDGETYWMGITRSHLDTPGNTDNLVMWSWCGGVTWNSESGIQKYLDSMSQLEVEYPGVTFVYMTGHLDLGWQENLLARNEQIRTWCQSNNKVLYDFADIESFSPDGTDYSQTDTDTCGWCYDWCATHDCLTCVEGIGCSHSHDFNCYQKGKAVWWMLSRLADWDGVLDVEDADSDQLPSNFTLRQNYPNPFNPHTTISFELKKRNTVRIDLFNLTGRLVATLLNEELPAGEHFARWDGTSSDGNQVASGIYLYRLTTDDGDISRKMLLLR